ncbi:hypothetical protein C1H46_022938 [Malus baccata]|uniref:Uncharacterized protein n=1 Tax=Malus baccata TaxID=106549 RepID=A0A540LYA8_MALBA|nr:hypothetical protein C1H46_022938 [Malus baccata]
MRLPRNGDYKAFGADDGTYVVNQQTVGFFIRSSVTQEGCPKKGGMSWGCHKLVASAAMRALGRSDHLLQWRKTTSAGNRLNRVV